MSVDILQMLVDSACSDGSITEQDRELLRKKASELGVKPDQLEKMIQNALNPVKKTGADKNSNDTGSGFITTDDKNIKKEEIIPPVINPDITKSSFSDISTLDNQGAMSLVYKAKLHGKWIIIKRIKPEFTNIPKYKELFYKEFENAYHLDHPNIVRLLDKGEDADGAFYTMEFVDGQPLTKLITSNGIRDERLVKKIMLQILDALTYVHKKQVFHRDLKPDNILVTYRGDNVKILDFGLAAADSFDDDLIKVGTPKYAAPEQMTKGYAVDQKSDIYTVGLIFLEMLTGNVNLQNVNSINNPNYRYIIENCTKQNQNERFHDCQDIAEWLNKPLPLIQEKPQEDLVKKELHDLKLQADTAFGRKDYQTAKSLFEQFLNKEPNNSDAKNKLQICLKNLQPQGNKKKFPIVPILVGVIVIALFVVGFIFKDKIFGSGKKENKDTTQVVAIDNFKIFKEKADSLFAQQLYEDALSFYEKAKTEKNVPEVSDKITSINQMIADRNQADIYFDKDKNLIKAIEFYKKVLIVSANDTHSTNRITECERIITNTKFADLVTKTESSKTGFTNADGYLVVDYVYDAISSAHNFWKGNGIIPVKKDDKWGYYIKSLKNFIECEYDKEGSYMQGNIVTSKNGQTAKINPNDYTE
jgi:serine/threonine protein kinase